MQVRTNTHTNTHTYGHTKTVLAQLAVRLSSSPRVLPVTAWGAQLNLRIRACVKTVCVQLVPLTLAAARLRACAGTNCLLGFGSVSSLMFVCGCMHVRVRQCRGLVIISGIQPGSMRPEQEDTKATGFREGGKQGKR